MGTLTGEYIPWLTQNTSFKHSRIFYIFYQKQLNNGFMPQRRKCVRNVKEGAVSAQYLVVCTEGYDNELYLTYFQKAKR